MSDSITIPSSPADLKKLKEVIQEITNSMAREDGEKEYQKEALDDLSEQFGINKKYLRRVAKEVHKDLYEKKVDEETDYQQLYESVMDAK